MTFTLPRFTPPDFSRPPLSNAPPVRTRLATENGLAPEDFHATSNHPEYVRLASDEWVLVPESRMDCVLVLRGNGLEAIEPRRINKGDEVVVGRTENGEEGIFVHTEGFHGPGEKIQDKFAFRTRGTRETSFSRSYDTLYEILRHDRELGNIVWVLGPAVAFDKDSRQAMQGLIEAGYCHALLAGNALATHDLEAALFQTGLGQDIYSQAPIRNGHYHHLDILNIVRSHGSIRKAIRDRSIDNGIMYTCDKYDVPYVLAGSIRDDGPLPEVIANVYEAQDTMRSYVKKATTVIAMATQLHSIAVGNMTPSYKVMEGGVVRPVFFYIVDISEFSVDKLANRGSTQTTAVVTNVQDFIVNLWRNLMLSSTEPAIKQAS
jgi:lysine-ketoglutarate reductase/saccharopine dehydrogenase-like protein (TIGR00300 family)